MQPGWPNPAIVIYREGKLNARDEVTITIKLQAGK
jgi:hypothetical protein